MLDKAKIDIVDLDKYSLGPHQIVTTYGKLQFLIM